MDANMLIHGKTRLRVYCGHGYWDGTFAGHDKERKTINNAKGVDMIFVKDKNGILHRQHPNQCRVLKTKKWPPIWMICGESGYPDIGPFKSELDATNHLNKIKKKSPLQSPEASAMIGRYTVRKYRAVKDGRN